MLNDVGLIHMNGRVYDPSLGRFLQADPYIQTPKNTQSYNRYSYLLNSPLSFTDPSGFVGEYDVCSDGTSAPPGNCPISTPATGTGGGSSGGSGGGGSSGGGGVADSGTVPTGGDSSSSPSGTTQDDDCFDCSWADSGVSDYSGTDVAINSDVPVNYDNYTGVGIDQYGNVVDTSNMVADSGMYASDAYSPDKGGWHEYTEGPTLVCTAVEACTADEIADQLSRYAVPGQDPTRPVVSGSIYDVYYPGTSIAAGSVVTTIGIDRLSITNRTLPGHVFHDGRIDRSALQVDGAWYVTTHGYGNNDKPSMATINEITGPGIFATLDQQMRTNIEQHR